jgi:hypothetical protein
MGLTLSLRGIDIAFRHLANRQPDQRESPWNTPQNGMQTPEIESNVENPPIGSEGLPISHNAICLSLILEKPVVATRSCSPIQTALLFFAPEWPGTSCAALSCLVSHIRSFLSRDVVAIRVPLALQDKLCTVSPCLSVNDDCPVPISHNFIVKSPDADARMFSAEGLKSTWPTFREWPDNFLKGATSSGSSASEYRVNPCGTRHMKTFPSSDPDAITRSLKGFLSVLAYQRSRTPSHTSQYPEPDQYGLEIMEYALAACLSHLRE